MLVLKLAVPTPCPPPTHSHGVVTRPSIIAAAASIAGSIEASDWHEGGASAAALFVLKCCRFKRWPCQCHCCCRWAKANNAWEWARS